MHVGQTSKAGKVRGAITVVALLAVFLAYWLTESPDRNSSRSTAGSNESTVTPAPAAKPQAAPPAAGPRVDRYDPTRVIASGETIVIQRTSLPSGAPVVVLLEVPAPPADVAALDVRLLAEGVEPLELSGALVGDARDRLQVEVGEWPWPARTILEVKTRERSHLPIRRYAVEVR